MARRSWIVAACAWLAVAVIVAAQPPDTAPRFRRGSAPVQSAQAIGGGEVVVELTIDAHGAVSAVRQVRDTPPFGAALASAVRTWQFEPATVRLKERAVPSAAQVLVAAVFRPPTTYAGPTAGPPPQALAPSAPRLPVPESLAMPAYPPNAVGEGVVLIEIEMTAAAVPRGYRVLGPQSGFDDAALDAVRAWRFSAARSPGTAEPVYVYAVLGFRPPVVATRRPPP